jgi:hypothetical protein
MMQVLPKPEGICGAFGHLHLRYACPPEPRRRRALGSVRYAIFYMEQGQGEGNLGAQDHARSHLRESEAVYNTSGDHLQFGE